MPFVVEAGGMFGPSVEKLLVLLEREAAANHNDIGGDFMAWSKRLLSIAIIQGNARLASDYLQSALSPFIRLSYFSPSSSTINPFIINTIPRPSSYYPHPSHRP